VAQHTAELGNERTIRGRLEGNTIQNLEGRWTETTTGEDNREREGATRKRGALRVVCTIAKRIPTQNNLKVTNAGSCAGDNR